MAKNQVCPPGREITSIDRCIQAEKYSSSLGLSPKRPLKKGTWPGLPFQCSAQTKTDDTFHFSSNDNTDNSRFVTGEFVMICEKIGRKFVTIVSTFGSRVNKSICSIYLL